MKENELKRPREIIKYRYLLVISFLSISLGYMVADVVILEIGRNGLDFFQDGNLLNNPGMFFFLNNNILYFIIISFLPKLNIFLVISQLMISGMHMKMISELDIAVQSEIFYRHFIFELVALLASVYISDLLYELLYKMYLYRKYDFKKEATRIGVLYMVVFLLTVIAAVLEGGAFVKN